MMKEMSLACASRVWHNGEACMFDDIRQLATSFQVVNEHWQPMICEVWHEMMLFMDDDPPTALMTAQFRLKGIDTHEL